jgi:acyl-CoA reductase-like NAD-dependent aldehyde dehydrogenase
MGPLIDEKQLKKVLSYVELGEKEGARLLYGGKRLTGGDLNKGFYMQPTIFTEVNNKMRIAREEIFGPVLVVIKFKEEAEAIEMANDSPYGLAGAVWSGEINRALKVAAALEAGTVWINDYNAVPAHSPFGGYKDSGFGRECHKMALEAYSQLKNIYVNTAETPAGLY